MISLSFFLLILVRLSYNLMFTPKVFNVDITKLVDLCEEGYADKCMATCLSYINAYEFTYNKNELSEIEIRSNSAFAEIYFQIGEIEYYGLIKKKPNLSEGLAYFIIASYFGNPKAQYKLYIMIETDIISHIIQSSDYLSLLNSSPILNFVSKTAFYKNFQYQSDDVKASIALQFLYTSSLFKYQPALVTLAYKYYKGYSVTQSCEASLRYYKESSTLTMKEITSRRRPNYYEKKNFAMFEYVGHKFANDQMDINDIIEYFKVEAQNGQINYMQLLGSRYLYGQGIPQDFDQAFYWFNMGAKFNNTECIFYLGEMYLNGWGVEHNYSEAFRLFTKATTQNFAKAWNSLGYMYYNGLGIEKNIKRAYDYFKIAIKKGDDADAYFNLITLLLEENLEIDVDFSTAYKYTNFIATKGHTFGTYFFGMLSDYQLGALIKSCDITIEFFKQVAERNLVSKRQFDLATKIYHEGFYKISALKFIELAEQGFEFGQTNAGIILKNYDVFYDKDFQKFLAFKYIKMAYKSRNLFATLTMADFYYLGFGKLPQNYTKAIKLYKKVITQGADNTFYIAHAYFNLGMMANFGYGMEANSTKALRYYNLSAEYEPNAIYPAKLMMYYNAFEATSLIQCIWRILMNFCEWMFMPGWHTAVVLVLLMGYGIFFYSISSQKD